MVTTMVVAAGPSAWATGLLHFSVTQVRQLELGTPAVRAYLDLRDLEGRPVEALPESSLTATLGQWNTEVLRVAPFASLDQGVAYVFLVDVSKSLNTDLFAQMIGGMETWVQGMGPSDQAAIIASGESSRLLTDFTGDTGELREALESLGPTDNATLLHQALIDGLDLCRRLDPGLPGRRALVIFSDGKDEGSAFVADDILDRLRDDPTPIYAIGYSRLRDQTEREEYLSLLQRFATNSGGAFYVAEQTRFAEAYDTIRQAIAGGWVADFSCPECRPDGSLQRLQVTVGLDGQVLSSGGSVRLLPVRATAEADDAGSSADATAPAEPRPDSAADTSSTSEEPGEPPRPWLNWLFGLVLLGLGILLWRWWSRRRGPDKEAEVTPVESGEETPPLSPIDPRSDGIIDPHKPPPMPGQVGAFDRPPTPVPTPRANAKAPPIQVRLVIVRGSRRGRQYSFVVAENAVVGKRSTCDCVLTDETGIDAEQFELLHEEGGLFIRNLSQHLPTLISGGPIRGKIRLTSDTLIGTGDTVLRIVFF